MVTAISLAKRPTHGVGSEGRWVVQEARPHQTSTQVKKYTYIQNVHPVYYMIGETNKDCPSADKREVRIIMK